MIEALLLDFDGLLYDTEAAEYQAWNDLYARYGLELELGLWVREAIGRPPGAGEFDPVARLQNLVGDELDLAALRAAGEEGKRQRLPRRLMPGAVELLDAARARGLRTAIVTSNHSANVRRHLARGLHVSLRCAHLGRGRPGARQTESGAVPGSARRVAPRAAAGGRTGGLPQRDRRCQGSGAGLHCGSQRRHAGRGRVTGGRPAARIPQSGRPRRSAPGTMNGWVTLVHAVIWHPPLPTAG